MLLYLVKLVSVALFSIEIRSDEQARAVCVVVQ